MGGLFSMLIQSWRTMPSFLKHLREIFATFLKNKIVFVLSLCQFNPEQV